MIEEKRMETDMKAIIEFLQKRQISEKLIREVENFWNRYPVEEKVKGRIANPMMFFYGSEILEMAIAGILSGENLLLCGQKATGKNLLAENLAWIFGRPVYNVSFHVNTDSSTLIGTDTFADNEVRLRKGPVYQCAVYGAFGILDEINMAKNDAAAVLHATLDDRRLIDVPGYEKIDLHPAARFIGTMNYGYAGTRELNEALVSRFLVIHMPPMNEEILNGVFRERFPDLKKEAGRQFCGLFLDLQKKAENGEISTKSIDLRGMLSALSLIRAGLKPSLAVAMGVVNKNFDLFEREMVEDIVRTRIPEAWRAEDVF
jgi:nitric oxide reductase NorQ protein